MKRSRKRVFFLLWMNSAVTFDSGEDDDAAAAAAATAAAWLCAGKLIREMNPQVKLLAGGGAAGVSHVASSCWRLPWRRPPRSDLQGCCFFFPLLGLQPDGGPSWARRPTHPPISPGHCSRPGQTNELARLTSEEHVWLPVWSADNHTMASFPSSLFVASCSVCLQTFSLFCVFLSLYCWKLLLFIYLFIFCKWTFISQTSEPRFFSFSFETLTFSFFFRAEIIWMYNKKEVFLFLVSFFFCLDSSENVVFCLTLGCTVWWLSLPFRKWKLFSLAKISTFANFNQMLRSFQWIYEDVICLCLQRNTEQSLKKKKAWTRLLGLDSR